MYVIDRIGGNFVEWQGTFTALFWLNVYFGDGSDVYVGWLYVLSRILYAVLALQGNLTRKGPRPPLFIATGLGYGVILYLFYRLSVILYTY